MCVCVCVCVCVCASACVQLLAGILQYNGGKLEETEDFNCGFAV